MKTLIITGGTGGLGSVVTRRLLEEGYKCVVPFRSVEEAQALRASIEPQKRDLLLLINEEDAVTEEAVERVIEAAGDFGTIYGLIHLLGGIRKFEPISATDTADFDFLLNLNLRSYFLYAKPVMKVLEHHCEGRIVGIAAMQGVKPAAASGGYGVAKAGVIALTKILAEEGKQSGITANCIAPGIIRTKANLEWGTEEEAKQWTRPEEIASAVLFLLSEQGVGVNGSVLQLFGGFSI